MTGPHDPRVTDAQRGAALIIVLLGMGTLLSLGLGLVSLTATETALAGHHEASRRAFYAADAAAEYVVRELMEAEAWDRVLDGTILSTWHDDPADASIDLAEETAMVRAETAAALAPGFDPPAWRVYAVGALDTILGAESSARTIVIVWVADDASEDDGNPSADSNGVITLLARAFGSHGARRSVMVSMARVPADETGEDHDDEEGSVMTTHVRSWRDLR